MKKSSTISLIIFFILVLNSNSQAQSYIDYKIRTDDFYAKTDESGFGDFSYADPNWHFKGKVSSALGSGSYSSYECVYLTNVSTYGSWNVGQWYPRSTDEVWSGKCLDNADNIYIYLEGWEEQTSSPCTKNTNDDYQSSDTDYDTDISGSHSRNAWTNFQRDNGSDDFVDCGTIGNQGYYKIEFDVWWNWSIPINPTFSLTSVTPSSFTINLTDKNQYRITDWDYQVSTNSTFTNIIASSTEIVPLSTDITSGLTPATTYYIQIRGENEAGTGSYTAYQTVTTANKPVVTTQAVSNVTPTTATGNGNVTATGGTNVTERGVYWSTLDGFADGAGTKVSTTGNWSATGAFTQAVTGLTANTIYYVKAFATNSAGSSYGSQVSFSSVTWDGSSSTDWDTGANWSDGSVPITSTHAIIPSGKTIIISPTTTASCASLSNSGTLLIQSTDTHSGSLIVSGISTGNITYQRYISGSRWHLVGSPVTGQDIGDLLTNVNATNDIVLSGSDYSMKDHTESSNNWSALYTSSTAGNFALGQGYAAKRNSDGLISFTGTVNTSSVTIPLSRGSYGWTLVANPYTSAIGVTVTAASTGECLTDNTSVMDANFSALYLWDEQVGYDGSRDDYKTISNAGGGTLQHYINVGQGFFIRSKSGGGNFVFTTSMQIHQNAASFKSTEQIWPTIRLNVQSDDLRSYTQIFYHEDMSRGLDVSYDAGMLKANPNFALYSRLIEDNGVDFAIQCLPKDYDNLIIPIGLDAQNGSVITFTAETLDLPEGYRLVIEDRKMDIFTTLESSEDSYSTTISAMDNFPRFYVHTKSALLAIDDLEQNDGLQIIPQPQNNLIQVIGDLGDNAQLLLYDMTGRNLLNTTLEQTNVNNVAVGLLKSGNYVVVIRSATQNSTKKISWIK